MYENFLDRKDCMNPGPKIGKKSVCQEDPEKAGSVPTEETDGKSLASERICSS